MTDNDICIAALLSYAEAMGARCKYERVLGRTTLAESIAEAAKRAAHIAQGLSEPGAPELKPARKVLKLH